MNNPPHASKICAKLKQPIPLGSSVCLLFRRESNCVVFSRGFRAGICGVRRVLINLRVARTHSTSLSAEIFSRAKYRAAREIGCICISWRRARSSWHQIIYNVHRTYRAHAAPPQRALRRANSDILPRLLLLRVLLCVIIFRPTPTQGVCNNARARSQIFLIERKFARANKRLG